MRSKIRTGKLFRIIQLFNILKLFVDFNRKIIVNRKLHVPLRSYLHFFTNLFNKTLIYHLDMAPLAAKVEADWQLYRKKHNIAVHVKNTANDSTI